MIVAPQAADALHLASVLHKITNEASGIDTNDASSAMAFIEASLKLHQRALHNLAQVQPAVAVGGDNIQPFTATDAATAAGTANAVVDVPVEQGQPKSPPEQLLRALDTARARANGEEAILPGDQWFNRECPAGASNPSPTPLGKRTASGASSIVLQPSAKKVTRSVASAWASEADKYWAPINYLDYENVPPKPMENLSPHNKLSDPQTFTFDAELTNNAGWRGRESSKWSVYRRGYRSYFRSPDGEVYRSLVDCRRAHYRQQLAMFDDLGSLKSFGSNSLGSLGAIEEFLKMEVGGKEEV